MVKNDPAANRASGDGLADGVKIVAGLIPPERIIREGQAVTARTGRGGTDGNVGGRSVGVDRERVGPVCGRVLNQWVVFDILDLRVVPQVEPVRGVQQIGDDK